jgi:hypothetical protein
MDLGHQSFGFFFACWLLVILYWAHSCFQDMAASVPGDLVTSYHVRIFRINGNKIPSVIKLPWLFKGTCRPNLYPGFLLGLRFHSEDEGDKNVGWLPTDYKALCISHETELFVTTTVRPQILHDTFLSDDFSHLAEEGKIFILKVLIHIVFLGYLQGRFRAICSCVDESDQRRFVAVCIDKSRIE